MLEEKRKAKLIALYGVNGSGKSTLSHLLGATLVDFDIVATDHLITLKRKLDTTNPVLRYSSYNQWERFGEPSSENIWRGFLEYRTTIRDYLHHILSFAGRDKPGMIIEGIHIEPPQLRMGFPEDDVRFIFLHVNDRELHLRRLQQKYNFQANMAGGRLEKYFPMIRTLQEKLYEEARSYNLPIIETSKSREIVLEQIKRVVE